MKKETHAIHLKAGKLCGRERTCGMKRGFDAEEKAIAAANAHNRWDGRLHDVEAYPCPFCHYWHIGKIMPLDILQAMADIWDMI